MQRKDITNAGALAVGSFSFIGWLLPAVLKSVGWVEWAQGLSAVFALFADPRISWTGIYLLLFIGALSTFIINNINSLLELGFAIREARKRHWDTTFKEAVVYVRYRSHFGQTLSNDKKTGLFQAAHAIEEMAKQKKLRTAGRRSGSSTLEEISSRIWNEATLNYQLLPVEFGYELYSESLGRDKENPKFEGLMFDMSELEQTWPRRR